MQLILADLSGGRPNCYYEAGFAHALGKAIIFAAQQKYTIHFDLANYRFIGWQNQADYRLQTEGSLDLNSNKRFRLGIHCSRLGVSRIRLAANKDSMT
jgi:hypothetical protein